MGTRNIDRLFDPRSIMVVGASAKLHSVGATVARNVLSGGFDGRVELVNPHHRTIDGRPCHKSVAAVSDPVDLAIVTTPPSVVPSVLTDLAARGTKAAVVLTAGLTAGMKQDMLATASRSGMRLLGPNCIGLLRPPISLNASFAHRTTSAGRLAFLSQSGALVTTAIDWAAHRNIGFSHIVSMGDMLDVDFGDLLDHLASDRDCDAILLYIEAITHAPKFLSAARRAARLKPVIALKAGRNDAAARAAFSHTGALAGQDAAYDAAFERCGVVRVSELEALFDAAALLGTTKAIEGERLAILTNGGGAGVLAADRLALRGGQLSALAPATIAALDKVLPATWSRGNPVDIIGDADGRRYTDALSALMADPNSDAILVMNCPTALHDRTEIADAVIGVPRTKPVLSAWLGAATTEAARSRFHAAGIPTFDTPASAIGGFMHAVKHHRAQAALARMPPPSDHTSRIDRLSVDRIIADALRDGLRRLPDHTAKAVLDAYGIPVVRTEVVEGIEALRSAAERMLAVHGRIALKILSAQITHKSDVGGVALDLRTVEEVVTRAHAMAASVAERRPDARIDGFTISPFVLKPRAHELILGITEDRTFGPMLLFGAGGTSVEVARDTALALPPLDPLLARNLMGKTRVTTLLDGYRDRPRADLAAIERALLALSALAVNHPEIVELDINPLLADADGVIAIDARMRITDPATAPRRPMAIEPYPERWQFDEVLAGHGPITIRPVRPEDECLYPGFLDMVTSADRRMRFFSASKTTEHAFLARLTQIDYAREMAFVVIDRQAKDLLGVSRFSADSDLVDAEFAILVRSDLKGKGLGWRLMHLLIDYARTRGLETLSGSVLEGNETMLKMCRELGFVARTVNGDPGIIHVTLQLSVQTLAPVPVAAQRRD